MYYVNVTFSMQNKSKNEKRGKKKLTEKPTILQASE